VKIGDTSNMQIGWLTKPVVLENVNDHDNYISLKVDSGAITCNDDFDESVSTSVQNGTVVKSRKIGKEWFINGERVANWCDCRKSGGAVPVISGRGEWTITAVESAP
jgi:hypothetical protein